MLRPASRADLRPWCLAARSCAARSTRYPNSALVRSVSLSRFRPCRSIGALPCVSAVAAAGRLRGIALDRAGHAARAAPAAAELAARDGHHLDAVLAQHRVRRHVALIAHHDAGRDGEVVGSVVPLLPLGGPDVLVV